MKYIALVAVVVAGLLIYLLNPTVVQFKDYSAATFTQQLAPLVLVAVFIERGLEIFITVWRGGDAATLQKAVDVVTALPDTDNSKEGKLKSANEALAKNRFETQRIAMPCALALGILISALGVRGLGSLADLDSLSSHPTQRNLFNLVDVLLTGAVMGGGSDFVHQLITTFTDLMDATSQKAKGQP